MRLQLDSQSTQVILVRHGQSTYNALGLYQGSSDRSLLTDMGRYQARKTGEFLKGLAIDAVYTSPLRRAQETTQEILKIRKFNLNSQKINTTSQLRETDLPAWQGLPFQYVRENFSEDYKTWKKFPHQFCMKVPEREVKAVRKIGNQEDINREIALSEREKYCYPALELYERVQNFWQAILPRHLGQTILIVSHGGTNRALISTALGLTPKSYHQIQQSNCGISVLNFPQGRLELGQVETINLATHVEESVPKLKESDRGLRLLLIPSESTHPEQRQSLSHLVKDINIDFSLSEDFYPAQAISESILKFHPDAVHLQVMREDFPRLWQQTIQTRKLDSSSQLITGLVVARTNIIRRMIGEALTLNFDQQLRVNLSPGKFSFLHYPNTDHPPILQAINVSKS